MGINIRRRYGREVSPELLHERFLAIQGQEEEPFIVQVSSHLIILKVREPDAHWWSPEMNLRIDAKAQHASVSEVVGPNSSIFTLAMFLIWVGGVALLASSMMALAQYQIETVSRLSIFSILISGLTIAGTLAILGMGRIKAQEQVSHLRRYVEDIMNP